MNKYSGSNFDDFLAEEGIAWGFDSYEQNREIEDFTENMTSTGREIQTQPGFWEHGNGDERFNGTPGNSGEGETPLPVELSSFSADYSSGSIVLNWITMSESNNLGWNIYRGNNEDDLINANVIQLNYELIDGNGTTTEPSEYLFVDEQEVYDGVTYWYWLENIDVSGFSQIYSPFSIIIPNSEETDVPEIPLKYSLRNYPNPFNPLTTISFALENPAFVKLSVYNLKGQKIKTLLNKLITQVNENVLSVWDGTDDTGVIVGSGIYYAQLKSGSRIENLKIILLK